MSTPRSARCTSPFSLVGFPSLVAPVTDVCELPVGVQIIAQPGRDHILLQSGIATRRSRDLSSEGAWLADPATKSRFASISTSER